MTRRSQDKGREAENFTALFLSQNGFPYIERRRLAGAKDKGDLAGSPGLMWEVKYLGARSPLQLTAWMREVDNQTVHAAADFGILVIKPPGAGERQAGRFMAAMRGESFWRLMHQAGEPGTEWVPEPYSHSNARLNSLPAKVVELDRIPGHDWVIRIPPRVVGTDHIMVVTLERIVKVLRKAGYGTPGASEG